jgi:hypothetical protein
MSAQVVMIKARRPAGESRTREEQDIVQHQMIERVHAEAKYINLV